MATATIIFLVAGFILLGMGISIYFAPKASHKTNAIPARGLRKQWDRDFR